MTVRLPCTDGHARCRCGFKVACRGSEVLHKCRPAPARPAGLGDVVAAGLEAVGITKARVSRWLGRPCRCRQRQAALNAILPDVAGLVRRPR